MPFGPGKSRESGGGADKEGLKRAALALASALDLNAAEQVVTGNPELLDIKGQVQLIKLVMEAVRQHDRDREALLHMYQKLLVRCKKVGIPAAFQEAREARPAKGPSLSDLVRSVVGTEATPAATAPAATSRTSAPPPVLSTAEPARGGLKPAKPAADPRVVRVFVSSTFRDMKAERDELVKQVFPALRKLCESRGVTWGEVDLRWGVTDEQKAEGQVLPICLAEIRGCRPYFIGLLGERYGWVPDAIDPALVEREPWLAEVVGRSVTELEILHGVLNDPAMAEHTFFYLRDPAYVDGKPADQFREIPTLEEIEALGRQEAERLAAERRVKLADLKKRIEKGGLPVRTNYPDPRALGELVLADLTAVIDRLYPAGSEPDALTREATEHEAFARSRAGVYIGRPDYFERLDAHAAGNGPPLVVLGDSGSGKSALLANWILRYREAHPDELVLAHFIGASPASTDWRAMVRRVIGELSRRFGFKAEIPNEPDALRRTFGDAVRKSAAKGRAILILDALDQLEDREVALELSWLPSAIPANVRLVLSTLPGRPLTELQKRAYPTLVVAPLGPAEREHLVVDYLASYTKALDEPRRQRIAAAPQCASPLYLRALLDELRLWGEHETLDAQIERYLAAPSVAALYELILERYQADYERDRPGLVRDAFSMLWAARRGLSETELLDLLGAEGQPLPRASWSPLFLAAESSLASRSGLLGFFHDYLRTAVRHRYLPGEDDERVAHLRLADYFAARELGPRKVAELPWQLSQASNWQRLSDLLADLEFLEAAWNTDRFEVRKLWAQVAASAGLRIVDVYRPILDAPDAQETDRLFVLATLLQDNGHPQQALSLYQNLAGRKRERRDSAVPQAALANQASVLRDRGDFDGAMTLLRRAERMCRDVGDLAGQATSAEMQAAILATRGDLKGAMTLYKTAAGVFRQLKDLKGLTQSLASQASIMAMCGDRDRAMTLFEEVERNCRELGESATLATVLGNRATILQERGDSERAMTLRKEQEQICREIGDAAGLEDSLKGQAAILGNRGDLDGAMALFSEVERICRESDNKSGLASAFAGQAIVLQMRGDLTGAMALLVEAEAILRKLGMSAELSACLADQATILQARGDLDGAMARFKAQERICRELGDPTGLATSLANQASILGLSMGRRREAMRLAEEAYRLASQHGLASLAQQIRPILDHLR